MEIDRNFGGYFEYEPLPPRCIRLMKILPSLEQANPEGQLHLDLDLEIKTVNLDDDVSFDALSYTWGPPTLEEIEEHSAQIFTMIPRYYPVYAGSRILLVTRSLRDALRRLRMWQTQRGAIYLKKTQDATMEPLLWADGLCIDQDDIIERSTQVALMHDIYSKAMTVWAYVGELGMFGRGGLEACATLCNFVGERREDPNNMELNPTQAIDVLSLSQWQDWAMFLSREWFSRTWVIQEVCLGGPRQQRHGI